MRTANRLGSLVAIGVFVAACGGEVRSSAARAQGEYLGACWANDTCDPGLECSSNLCLPKSTDGGGTTSTGGATSAGTRGVASTGGATSTGGASSTGGATSTGGASSTGSTGGASSTGSTGGATSTGGFVGGGGAPPEGGVSAAGGAEDAGAGAALFADTSSFPSLPACAERPLTCFAGDDPASALDTLGSQAQCCQGVGVCGDARWCGVLRATFDSGGCLVHVTGDGFTQTGLDCLFGPEMTAKKSWMCLAGQTVTVRGTSCP